MTVLFGGAELGRELDETWEFDGLTWNRSVTPIAPSPRTDHAMSYDGRRGRTVLFGGIGPFGQLFDETWEYDGASWVNVAPAVTPPLRGNMDMVYDEARGVTVLLAGQTFVANLDLGRRRLGRRHSGSQPTGVVPLSHGL
ncbi:MAG: kelch repeat-containing protein [Planctomycetota bacterium]